MKLIIKRDQKAQTGILGGHKGMTFLLSCRIVLTPEEQALVAKYKAENHPITFRSYEGRQVPGDTVAMMKTGVTQELKNIKVLLQNESAIKHGCLGFKRLLEVMATFGGEEVIEITAGADDSPVPPQSTDESPVSAAPPAGYDDGQ